MKKKIISGQLIILILCWAIGIPCLLKGLEKTSYTLSDVDNQWAMSAEEALENEHELGNTMVNIGGVLFIFGGVQFAFFHTLAKEKKKKEEEKNAASVPENIAKLKELMDSGAITEEEYNEKKEELLKKIK